jgi:hypothetical protein
MQTRSVFLAMVLGLIVVHTTVSAQVTFYTNRDAWLAAVTKVETFRLTPAMSRKLTRSPVFPAIMRSLAPL